MLILAVVVGVVLLAVSLHLVFRTLADMALIGIVLIPFVWTCIYIFMRNVIFTRSLSPHSKDFPTISLYNTVFGTVSSGFFVLSGTHSFSHRAIEL